MKKKNLFLKLSSTLMAVVFLAMSSMMMTSCGDDDEGTPTPDPEPENTILEILAADDELSGLLGLLEADDLDAVITATGDFTLFAPTNDALASLLETLSIEEQGFGSVSANIREAVLSYHLSTTVVMADDLPETITTVQGEDITVNGTLLKSGASAEASITESIRATNGVVHKVNRVLVPPTIGIAILVNIELLTQPILLAESFSHLRDAILYADEDESVADGDKIMAILANPTANITVFAPVNGSFEAAAANAGVTVTQFIEGFDRAVLRGLILNHAVPRAEADGGDIEASELTTGATFTTAYNNGETNGQLAFFNNTDAIPADNGIGVYIDSNGTVDFQDNTTFTTFNGEVALPNAFNANNGRIHAVAGILTPYPPQAK